MFSYDNIGRKIKNLAQITFVVEAISTVIAGIATIASDSDMILVGLILIVGGPFVAWVSSWLLYGFGELIEKTSDNESNTREILNIMKKQATNAQPSEAAPAQENARTSKPVVTSTVKAKPIPGGWTCECGRNHADYESSCICGTTKWDMKKKSLQK